MSERRDAAAILAMCSWVKKRIARIEDHAKILAEVSYPDEKTAAAVGGTVVGYTSRVSRKPVESFTILDRAGFIDWVGTRWPSEIEPAVRPAFMAVLAENAESHDGILIDESGEVCPHVKLADPIVYTMTRLSKDADGVLAPLLKDRSLESLPGYIEAEPEKNLDEEGQ